jgi:hypothetical protein
MWTKIDPDQRRDAILACAEADGAFAAWTLEELHDDLGSLRPAFAGGDDAAS